MFANNIWVAKALHKYVTVLNVFYFDGIGAVLPVKVSCPPQNVKIFYTSGVVSMLCFLC